MLTVFKYPIEIDDYFEVNLPKGSRVLTIDIQDGEPQLWALVDSEMPMEVRRFRFTGTGHPINGDPGKLEYINTFQMRAGALIFHIFEVLP